MSLISAAALCVLLSSDPTGSGLSSRTGLVPAMAGAMTAYTDAGADGVCEALAGVPVMRKYLALKWAEAHVLDRLVYLIASGVWSTRSGRVLNSVRSLGSTDKDRYLQEMLPEVNRLSEAFQIHAALVFGQMIAESGWSSLLGRRESTLVGRCSNLFAVKATGTQEDRDARARRISNAVGYRVSPATSFSRSTQEEYSPGERVRVEAEWACYESPRDSVAHYVYMLANSSRYSGCRQFTDPYQQLLWVWLSGYATSSTYFDSVAQVIESLTGVPPTPAQRTLAYEAGLLSPRDRRGLRDRLNP